MKRTMLYIIVGIIVVGSISVIAYMRHIANRTPSIPGNAYDKEMQEKIKIKNTPENSD